jgi:pimeloyl-ACP methyl ester carboxylesterase
MLSTGVLRRDPAGSDTTDQLACLTVGGRGLEYAEIPGEGPSLLLLHEGLGSARLWRDFPAELAAATGLRTLAFSRFGHGGSDPPARPRTPSFMHEEARVVLPDVRAQLDLHEVILVGHSDGASIALIHAAEHPVCAVVAIAPHVFVEEMCLAEIRAARRRYTKGLRERLIRHHQDPDAAFYGWNDVWLHPDFPKWDVRPLLPQVVAPLLLIQGEQDRYGTMAQLDEIEAAVRSPVERVHLNCGHAPHLEASRETLHAISRFARTVAPRGVV